MTREMIGRYPRFEDFCEKFSLQNLREWASAPDIGGMCGSVYCMLAPKAPTVGMMSDAYGSEQAAGWIASHLNQFVTISSVASERKPAPETLMQTGRAWLTEWPQLKVTEVWVFFNEILAGKHGQLAYGGIEMSTLGVFLSRHMEARFAKQAKLRARLQAEKRRREEEEFEKEKQELIRQYHSPEFLALPKEEQEKIKRCVAIWCGIITE